MAANNTPLNVPDVYLDLSPEACSSCGEQADFVFLGEQRWPEAVARKMGLSALMTLWRCGCCNTTLTIPVSTDH